MKAILALLAAVAMIGSAAAWDINEKLDYTYMKWGEEQGDYRTVLPQIIGTTSGAYAKQPNINWAPDPDGTGAQTGEWPAEAWLQIDNTLVGVNIDRTNSLPLKNPSYSAEGNDFAFSLTQGGSASLAITSKNTLDNYGNPIPEIAGEASAYQNLGVKGEFAKTDASFDSRAIVGFKPVSDAGTNVNPNNFVVTDVLSATSSIDSDSWGAGYFNSANMGVSVEADIRQDYSGSGWDNPSYSGGITMWANFDGAHDPHCANPIQTTVAGSAWTGLFPANIEELQKNTDMSNAGVGDVAYWGADWATNPQANANNNQNYPMGGFNAQWANIWKNA